MAGGSVTIRKDVSGTLVVDITSAAGGTPTFYSDAALTASVSFPDSITTSKTYYIGVSDQYVLSVKRNGLEIANSPDGTRSFRLEDTHLSVSPGPDASNTEAASEGASLTASNAFTGNNTFTGANTFSGTTAVKLGTAALPSIVPTGDTDTGIWSPAADTLAVSTGGTERMRIDSAGNAHFGSAFNGSADLNISDGTTYLGLNISGAVSYMGNTSNHPIALIANNTERMRIDTAGLITGTGSSLGEWTAYTPTASAGSGTATTVTAAGRYTVIGKTCTVTLSLAITNKGTAGDAAVLTLPFNAASGSRVYCGSGRENGATGGALQVIADPGADAAIIFLANGGTPWVDTYLLLVTMTYEIA